MEDNFTDKHIVDQAWSMMRSTLDKEMPVQKKKRFIWWIPILLGAALLGGWYFTASTPVVNPSMEKSITEQPEEKITSNANIGNTTNSKTTIEKPKQINIEEKNSLKTKTKTTSATITPKPRPNNIAKAKTEITKPTTVAVQNPNNQKQSIQNQKSPKSIISFDQTTSPEIKKAAKKKLDLAELNQNQITKPLTDEKEEKFAIEEPRKREALTIINSLPYLSLSRFDIEEERLLGQAVNLPKNKKMNLAFKTAFLTDVRFRTPTLLKELQVIKKLNPKWSVLSGLGIKSQFILRNSNGGERFASQTNDESSFDPINNEADFDPALSSGGFSFSPSSRKGFFFSFLYVPVTAIFNVKNSWKIEGGVHYNFLSLVGTYELPGFSTTNPDGYKNHNHFAFHFSTNYQLNKKSALFFQYQTNTQRFAKGNRIHDRHQIGVGFKRQF